MTLKENTGPICSSLFLCYSHNYWRLRAKSLPHGLNENLTIPPTIHDEVTLFGLRPSENGRGGGGGGEREGLRSNSGRILVRSSNLNHRTAIIIFSPKNFLLPKSVKCKTNVAVLKPAPARLKAFLLFHNPAAEKSCWLRRRAEEWVSERAKKFKINSSGAGSAGTLPDRPPLKMKWCLRNRQTK